MISSSTTEPLEVRPLPFVPVVASEELALRNAAAIALLDEWEADAGSDQDQRDTMDVLRRTLGPDRVASNRPAIRP